MPRGRHRHSPPLHRLLPPSVIAGVSLVCAFGPWVFSDPGALRVIAASAAAVAVVGAAVMRRWDAQAGKQVADLARGRASDEWRHEERVAELETDLEESRELRTKLEQRLRAKRAELAGLRNEHAALLRRYATAETERASALEGRRLLEIETVEPSRALPPAPEPEPAQETTPETDAAEAAEAVEEEKPAVPAVFSPEGSRLFLRAKAALSRFDDGDKAAKAGSAAKGDGVAGEVKGAAAEVAADGARAESVQASVQAHVQASAQASVQEPVQEADRESGREPSREDEAQGQPEAVDEHEHAAAATTTEPAPPAASVRQPEGHFTVPTAVAVLPAAPMPRPLVTGGFDFFGTQKGSPSTAFDAVQNEDLADVVGQEALALHKAEAEAAFKPFDEESRGVGQVIDLTAHDETEQIDMQGLRTAAS
ncbi:hypothetical protein ACIPSA_37725 [Streptomyces sp. NPDC086549]|uniref:hypothetical protein n=1 Tax=Streptomyces sp. NPDC086549 TaxID=3365752 RepID=UPI003806C731